MTEKAKNMDPREMYPKPSAGLLSQQAVPGLQAKMKTKPDCGEETYKGSDRLKDKVCLITGGDSGIGRAVAIAFAKEGAKGIAISYLPEEECDAQNTRAFIERNTQCLLSPGNLQESDKYAKELVKAVVDKFGRIDVLVLNAGVNVGKKKFEEYTRAMVESTFQVNVLSQYDLIREAQPHMPKGSAIVLTSSVQAWEPEPGMLPYAATKGAMVNLTKCAAHDLIKYGIRVNAVCPGPILTPMIEAAVPSKDQAGFGSDTPIQRAGQPVEVAPAFVFLADQCSSSYVLGECIGVCGGLTIA